MKYPWPQEIWLMTNENSLQQKIPSLIRNRENENQLSSMWRVAAIDYSRQRKVKHVRSVARRVAYLLI